MSSSGYPLLSSRSADSGVGSLSSFRRQKECRTANESFDQVKHMLRRPIPDNMWFRHLQDLHEEIYFHFATTAHCHHHGCEARPRQGREWHGAGMSWPKGTSTAAATGQNLHAGVTRKQVALLPPNCHPPKSMETTTADALAQASLH
jgi:hypothetical protein